jgi:lysine 2,3-aminomutase
MSDWQQIIKDQSIASLEKLADKFGHDVIDVEALKPAFDNFQMRITPAALEQIKEVGDPMWNQYVPTVEELDVVDGVIDSLDEDGDSPVPNITHRYPDRALFLVSPICASYCRFCTRRRKVGDPEKIPLNQYDSAFKYLREHTEIRDVIMSGGDAERPETGVSLPAAARDSAHRDYPPREPHHLAPAGTDHAGILRDGSEVPPDFHEHALQSSK